MTSGREQSRVGRVRALARPYPTITFFVLTFLITWALWVPRVLAPESVAATLALLGTWGPAIAAVIVAALLGNLRDLGARLVRWRVGWQWYAVVLLGPAAFYAAVVALDIQSYGESFPVMLVELPAMSVLYTWVFQHTAGSALTAILLHASGSWWRLFTVSATEADAPVLIVVLLKWLLAAAVAVSWLRQVPAGNRRRLAGAP